MSSFLTTLPLTTLSLTEQRRRHHRPPISPPRSRSRPRLRPPPRLPRTPSSGSCTLSSASTRRHQCLSRRCSRGSRSWRRRLPSVRWHSWPWPHQVASPLAPPVVILPRQLARPRLLPRASRWPRRPARQAPRPPGVRAPPPLPRRSPRRIWDLWVRRTTRLRARAVLTAASTAPHSQRAAAATTAAVSARHPRVGWTRRSGRRVDSQRMRRW
mmetsp:Transcript_19785/g.62990  ORF Transcript_19785/g.62990 Transcript_19785/m.62990 type:complete len:213 (+) Transcript_19785:873-1511(+)